MVANRHLLVGDLVPLKGCRVHCVLEGGLHDLYVADVVVSHVLGSNLSQLLNLLAQWLSGALSGRRWLIMCGVTGSGGCVPFTSQTFHTAVTLYLEVCLVVYTNSVHGARVVAQVWQQGSGYYLLLHWMTVHAGVESHIHFGDLFGTLVFVQVLTMNIKTLPSLMPWRLRLYETSCHFLLLLSMPFIQGSYRFVRLGSNGLSSLRVAQVV